MVRCCCRLVTHWYTWALADKKGEQLLKYSQHFTDIMAKRCIAVGQAGCKERWLWLVEESPEAVRRPPQNTSSRRAARWKNKQTPGQQTTAELNKERWLREKPRTAGRWRSTQARPRRNNCDPKSPLGERRQDNICCQQASGEDKSCPCHVHPARGLQPFSPSSGGRSLQGAPSTPSPETFGKGDPG